MASSGLALGGRTSWLVARPSRVFGIASALVIGAVSLSSWGPPPADDPPPIDFEVAGPVKLTADSLSVSALAVNTTRLRERGRVWWSLTPLDGETPVFKAPARTIDLRAGERVSLVWTEFLALPSGRYDVSLWVHHLVGRRLVHSEGRRAFSTVDLSRPDGWFRSAPATGPLVVSRLRVPDIDDLAADLVVTIFNRGEAPAMGRVILHVAPPADAAPWERALQTTALLFGTVQPGRAKVITVPRRHDVPKGDLEASVWLQAVQHEDFVPSDGVRIVAPLTERARVIAPSDRVSGGGRVDD